MKFRIIIHWIRLLIIRILRRQYPNKNINHLRSLKSNNYTAKLTTSTGDKYISPVRFKHYQKILLNPFIDINIFFHKDINNFMKTHYKNTLIYKIFLDLIIPVSKIDIFRLCYIYKYGGAWIDFKSDIDLEILTRIIQNNECVNGLFIHENRSINIYHEDKRNSSNYKAIKVIHNGFFYSPPKSIPIQRIIDNIIQDSSTYYDKIYHNPKNAILDLTGPIQFTKTIYSLEKKYAPKLVPQEDLGFIYLSRYSRYISPFTITNPYSQLRNGKILVSDHNQELE